MTSSAPDAWTSERTSSRTRAGASDDLPVAMKVPQRLLLRVVAVGARFLDGGEGEVADSAHEARRGEVDARGEILGFVVGLGADDREREDGLGRRDGPWKGGYVAR